MPRTGTKLCVALASLALALLVSEGLLSLFAGTSWRLLLGGGKPETLTATDAERFHAAALTPGPYRCTEDPFVPYTLKASTEVDTLEGRPEGVIHTDELGMRLRTGPPAGPDPLRIVVLGDSVAFGYGLRDDEVLAAALERCLRSVLAPGAREVVCSTVATPGWNYRNALRFLLDHLEALDPDLVLYLPVKNDLEDSYGVTEAGQRREANDPVVPGARLYFRPETGIVLLAARKRFAGRLPDTAFGGPEVHFAGLTASSRWRLADMAELLIRTEERLERRGARLVLVPHAQTDYHRLLRCELLDRGRSLPVVPLFENMEPTDTLGWDPHPSARTVALMARFLAGSLIERGWVGPAASALPELTEGEAARRARELGDDELPAWRAAYRERTVAELRARIAPEDLEGMQQVYGGLNLDASMATDLAAVLPAGQRLRVHVEAIEEAADLYPLELRVRVNGHDAGIVRVEKGAESEQVLPVEAGDAGAPFEVWIEAADWASVKMRGRSFLVSARLLELESLSR